MKTAVQAVFSELEELHPNLFNVNTTEGKEFINHFHKFLSMEKEQIENAFSYGQFDLGMEADEYYKHIFKPESNETL
jgi:hypothetical protein